MANHMFLKLCNQNGLLFGIRHLQAFLLFMCCTLSYFIRINVSVAVVAMTNRNTTNPDFQEFQWNEKEKSYIFSSFYWGYVITQLPGGWLAERYGCKPILFFSVLIPAIFSLFTPLAVEHGGWLAFSVIRIIQGLCQGVTFPAYHSFLAKWAPFNERNKLGAIIQSGIEFGTVLAFSASGFIAASNMGWPGISYISGGLGILWCVFWLYFGANTPAESKIISLEERKYIETSGQQSGDNAKRRIPTPWLSIFKSTAFLTLLFTRICESFGFITMLTQIPTYMNKILQMDIKSNSIYSGIPYVVMLIVGYLMIILADVLASKGFSLSVVRKSFNTISFWIPAAALVSLGFVTVEYTSIAIALLIIAVGSMGAHTIGSSINTIDLSPNHAGTLMGIINTFGNVTGILAPLITGVIVTNEKDQVQWRIIFYISAILFFVGNLLYLLFGKFETQPWNEPKALENSTVSKMEEGLSSN